MTTATTRAIRGHSGCKRRPDRDDDDPLRGKSDGEILMRYEF